MTEEAVSQKESDLQEEFEEMAEEPEESDGQKEPVELFDTQKHEQAPEAVEASAIPDDPLIELAVDLFHEEDYIVSDENVKDIQFLAFEIKDEYDENDRALQMTRRVREVIDKAEKRSMSKLLEVVNNGSYGTSEFLILKKEDFSN